MRRREAFTRARVPVAVAMRLIAATLPAEPSHGRRSVFSARAKSLLAAWRDEGRH